MFEAVNLWSSRSETFGWKPPSFTPSPDVFKGHIVVQCSVSAQIYVGLNTALLLNSFISKWKKNIHSVCERYLIFFRISPSLDTNKHYPFLWLWMSIFLWIKWNFGRALDGDGEEKEEKSRQLYSVWPPKLSLCNTYYTGLQYM